MNVVALLPYLFITYEDANNFCITNAHNIVRVYTVNLHREPLNQHDPLQQTDQMYVLLSFYRTEEFRNHLLAFKHKIKNVV